ncbi:MAG: fibrillarin-like rRNA/tRNA 2'-O-methyltransferase [Euryarchaeota archaeon]|nr:fibrillarin-like rRNA/tRNA 2'-O-methyltransferase [Euryarchaeota archaeon]
MKELLPGVYEVRGSPATVNLVPGMRVYGERLVREGDREYRLWNPRRSKLSAAVLKGLSSLPIREDSPVLYLGAASGTTASHVSDLCPRGVVYCVEMSRRSMADLYQLARRRPNMVPIMADARNPEGYPPLLERCELIYQDIAQRDQAAILVRNADWYLRDGGEVLMAVKAKSIDVSAEPWEVFEKEMAFLKEKGFRVREVIELEPYHRHLLRARKK